MERLTEKHYLAEDHYMKCSEDCNVDMDCVDCPAFDRIDVDKGYSPNNCRWVTMAEQQANKRSNVFVECNGETMTLAEASRRIGISESAVWMRVKRGIPVDRKPFDREKPVMRDDGVIYCSVKEAAKDVMVGSSKVSAVCKGKRKRTRGYSFRYLTHEEAEKALQEMEGKA